MVKFTIIIYTYFIIILTSEKVTKSNKKQKVKIFYAKILLYKGKYTFCT